MKLKIIFLLAMAVYLFASCNKETEDWSFCTDCTFETWIGTFKGDGEYYDSIHNEGIVKNVPIEINIENPYNQTLKVTISSPREFSWEFAGQKSDNDYFLNIAGSSQSIILNMYKNDKGDYKLSGVAKLYEYNLHDSIYHTTASATFEVKKE